jgi:1-acyl-sn-glycerol-3-phosphate acyltransferase
MRKPNQPQSKRWAQEQSVLVYRALTVVGTLVFKLWVRRLRAVGVDNVPATGGMFMIANHTTGMDPFILGYTIRQRMLRGPGKVELFQARFFNIIMWKMGMFPLRQGALDAGAVRTMVQLFRAGSLIVIFPEGGRSVDGELHQFSPNFARLMIKLKAPLAPAGIAGGRDLLPIGSYLPRPNTPVVVAYGETFDLSAFHDRELTSEVTEEAAAYMRERVLAALTVARAERSKMMTGS